MTVRLTVVAEFAAADVILTDSGFYARCKPGGCEWVSECIAAKHLARAEAQGHECGTARK